ncbi:ATP-dependent helicase HrpA [Methylohalomonas lacus]|uniref:ATP-dependent helicase HrpA n=1 Tax=Methylohalomonas lacus TaxID=398773 RepID=A0AAE3L0L0_9GAMM|nr:ATP-dependent RNA helicase HrpA [Methylohalomonas lacus]MCS3902709.1 ATP-dependent helicase HrpA [Methylohalomonas lacus]
MSSPDTAQPETAALNECTVRDRRRLSRRRQQDAEQWRTELAAARSRYQARREHVPTVDFPADLPITAASDDIIAAIRDHQVTIVCGETGSGKTTQLPKLCLAAGRGVAGFIGHTQPRRLAARTLAARVASELGSEIGAAVGYKIRHQDSTNSDSYIKLMTDGILLAELRSDRDLLDYDTLIIDEAHERSLNIDFILGYLRQLLKRRPDLKVIITSATIDVERFSEHFDNAPIIEVSGRSYPVEVRYRPYEDDDDDLAFEHAVLNAVRELSGRDRGDILVFLEGEREIHELARFLRKQDLPDTDVLPLYARLGAAGQGQIFQPHQRRHIVLATNIAETSLTIPGIRYVIDSGYARISRYSPRSKVQRLPIEKIAKAPANQRKGRCGRESDGICIRLYSEADFEARPDFTEPEIRRTNLASVVLQMKTLGLGEVEKFPFLEPPDQRQINDAVNLLVELGAIDSNGSKKAISGGKLTPIGRQLAKLPLDPSFGRMLLAAGDMQCLNEALIIVSGLSIQDPRERPLETQQKADQSHQQFRDERSDFLEFLKLWDFFERLSAKLSKNQFRHACRENFLAYVRVREWRDIHRQLSQQMRELGYKRNSEAAGYESLHTALATGLLGHVAQKTGPGEYTGARNIKLKIFPGSSQFAKQPKWFMAAELVETSQLFARTVAAIDPEWLLKPAAHLLRTETFEPQWNAEAQRINARQRVTLYGLPLVTARPVDYARIDPDEARKLFIQHALVEGELRSRAGFYQHNRKLIEQIRREEQKIRRPDVLDEQRLFAFYDDRLPATVTDGASLEKWRRRAEQNDPHSLYAERDQLIRKETATAADYPDELHVNGIVLPVDYAFRPGAEDDGVTIDVPLQLLNQFDSEAFERLVPGLLEEKITALLKSLPKSLRRRFVPIPDTARRCLADVRESSAPLPEALAACLLRQTGVEIPADAWQAAELPAHLTPRFRLIDDNGSTLASERDYQVLREQFGGEAARSFAGRLDTGVEREDLTDWNFGELPEVVELEQGGYRMRAYPALVDCADRVAIRCFDTAAKAASHMQAGLLRLFCLALDKEIKYLRRNLPDHKKLCLAYSALGNCEELTQRVVEQAVIHACQLDHAQPRTQADFEQQLETGRKQLVSEANSLCALLSEILQRHTKLRSHLSGNVSPQWLAAIKDIREQLDHLVFAGFINAVPVSALEHYPRYLDAIDKRLQQLEQNPARDRERAALVAPWWQDYLKLASAHTGQDNGPEQLHQYRWLIEEYRVSVFAQELKTAQPVSPQRLQAARDELRRAR